MATKLAAMSEAELEAEVQRLGNARDAAYAKAGDAMRAIQTEITRRRAKAKLAPALAGLSPEAKAALLDELKEG